MYTQQSGQAAAQAQAEQNAGIPDLQKSLNEINGQINGLNSSAFTQTQNAEGRLAPTFSIYGQQAQIERQKSAQTFGLAAASNALQGNIALAQDNVKRAIDAQFGGVESQLKYQALLLDQNKENMSAAEKKQADLLQAKLADRNEQVAKEKANKETLYGLATAAAQNGAPPAVLSAIMNGTLETALNAASGYLGKETVGSVQEYQFAVKNGYKGSFTQYQNEDANRKIAIAHAASATGLSPTTLTKVTGIAGQFDNEPVVKEYNTIATQLQAVKTLGNTPTDDIQRVYAFAKVMDPNSVVREGEYKTVQDYSQALFQAYGLRAQRIFDNSGFLTAEARSFLLGTLQNRFNATAASYKNIYDEYGRRINKISGASDGTDYLTNYSGGYSSPSSGSTASTPQGIHIMRNGVEGYISSLLEFNSKTDKML